MRIMSPSRGKPLEKRIIVGCLPIIHDPELISKLASYRRDERLEGIQGRPAEHEMRACFAQLPMPESGPDRDSEHKPEPDKISFEPSLEDWVHLCSPDNKSMLACQETIALREAPVSSPFSCSSSPNHEPYFLLITSREHPSTLVLPKGGLHADETGCCGAMRETWEEAGITGSCGRLITRTENSLSIAYWYELNVDRIYYQWPEASQRERVWIPISNVANLGRIRKPALKVIQHWKDHCYRKKESTKSHQVT